jgi:hypothetical protein
VTVEVDAVVETAEEEDAAVEEGTVEEGDVVVEVVADLPDQDVFTSQCLTTYFWEVLKYSSDSKHSVSPLINRLHLHISHTCSLHNTQPPRYDRALFQSFFLCKPNWSLCYDCDKTCDASKNV